MKKLHLNINQYTKSGSAPIKAAGRGENTIGICFQHDGVKQAVKGLPVTVVSPSEGTGYEVGSMSIIEGARNLDEAKQFFDWALSAEIQTLTFTSGTALQVPANKNATHSTPGPTSLALTILRFIEKIKIMITRSAKINIELNNSRVFSSVTKSFQTIALT